MDNCLEHDMIILFIILSEIIPVKNNHKLLSFNEKSHLVQRIGYIESRQSLAQYIHTSLGIEAGGRRQPKCRLVATLSLSARIILIFLGCGDSLETF